MKKLLKLPFERSLVGIDIGGTLAKVAFTVPPSLFTSHVDTTELTRDTLRSNLRPNYII
jgi:hypothetical protein